MVFSYNEFDLQVFEVMIITDILIRGEPQDELSPGRVAKSLNKIFVHIPGSLSAEPLIGIKWG